MDNHHHNLGPIIAGVAAGYVVHKGSQDAMQRSGDPQLARRAGWVEAWTILFYMVGVILTIAGLAVIPTGGSTASSGIVLIIFGLGILLIARAANRAWWRDNFKRPYLPPTPPNWPRPR